ncbi:hypothetical protein BDN70DRAFT_939744 [Pholiota conissans]|uniref:Uncharacterized protein n=1 Tax=Pholiota conissans TaxID=109636 RepID=A0A9P5YJF6_9AGAR|nr:hypothetical protein BDN70DRAFT_939744 [Pholiota conissans]
MFSVLEVRPSTIHTARPNSSAHLLQLNSPKFVYRSGTVIHAINNVLHALRSPSVVPIGAYTGIWLPMTRDECSITCTSRSPSLHCFDETSSRSVAPSSRPRCAVSTTSPLVASSAPSSSSTKLYSTLAFTHSSTLLSLLITRCPFTSFLAHAVSSLSSSRVYRILMTHTLNKSRHFTVPRHGVLLYNGAYSSLLHTHRNAQFRRAAP